MSIKFPLYFLFPTCKTLQDDVHTSFIHSTFISFLSRVAFILNNIET